MTNLRNNIKNNIDIQDSKIRDGDIIITLKTSVGDIKLKLFKNLVPNTVNNFVGLAQKGYYNHTIFHRVINNFMIQGGDPTGTGMGGESIFGGNFDDEFNKNLSNIKYSISMANSGENSNGSQFFINQNDNINLDFNKPPFSSKHAVFGQVIEGKNIIDNIAKTKTDYSDKPLEDIIINNVIIKAFNSTNNKLVDYKIDIENTINKYKTN